jgi:hypothetical protein
MCADIFLQISQISTDLMQIFCDLGHQHNLKDSNVAEVRLSDLTSSLRYAAATMNPIR